MYGSFTKSEVETVELWVNSMAHNRMPFYHSFIEPMTRSLCQEPKEPGTYKRASPVREVISENLEPAGLLPNRPLMRCTEGLAANLHLSSLLPLWFTQCCLLESFLYAPGRTTDTLGCAVVLFLRVQSGFETEPLLVTGKDEFFTLDNGGIVELGLEMIRRASLPVPQDLQGILSCWPSEFSRTMLELAARPIHNLGALLGMSMAFLELQEMVSEFSNPSLLCPKSSERLALLVRKQYQCLQICLKEILARDGQHVDFHHGYDVAKAEINKCLIPTG